MGTVKEIHFKSMLLAHEIKQLSSHVDEFNAFMEPLYRDEKNSDEDLSDVKARIKTIEDFLENMLHQFKHEQFVTRPAHKVSAEQDRKIRHMLKVFEFNMPWKKASSDLIPSCPGGV